MLKGAFVSINVPEAELQTKDSLRRSFDRCFLGCIAMSRDLVLNIH